MPGSQTLIRGALVFAGVLTTAMLVAAWVLSVWTPRKWGGRAPLRRLILRSSRRFGPPPDVQGHELGVNGWLPRHQDVVPLPTGLIDAIEGLCEKPDRMILGDAVSHCLGEQENLIPGQWGLVPSTHTSQLHTTAPFLKRPSDYRATPCVPPPLAAGSDYSWTQSLGDGYSYGRVLWSSPEGQKR